MSCRVHSLTLSETRLSNGSGKRSGADSKLPIGPEYRRCFELHYVEERSYDEIADMLDLPLGTVKSRLSRAKRELKRMLEPAT